MSVETPAGLCQTALPERVSDPVGPDLPAGNKGREDGDSGAAGGVGGAGGDNVAARGGGSVRTKRERRAGWARPENVFFLGLLCIDISFVYSFVKFLPVGQGRRKKGRPTMTK